MDMKRDYYEDVALFTSPVAVFWFLALIVLLALLPLGVKNYYVYLVNYLAINVIVVMGLNILVVFTGQVSLGHAGFFAVGAYGTVLFMTRLNLPFVLALPAAALAAALLGFLLGLPALRLEGPYLTIATLGFGITITQVIWRIEAFGGRQGLHAPDLIIGPWHLDSDRAFYYLAVSMAILLTVAAHNIIRTRVGRAFVAIRDAEIAAETIGVNLTYYKTLAFALSAFYAGIGGGLYAFVLRFIEPELFSLMMSIMFLAMAVVGGLGSIMGAVTGACLLTWLDLQLRNITSVPHLGAWLEAVSRQYFTTTGLSNIQFVVFGTILILIMIFEPLGLYGFWIRAKKYWKNWPF